MSEPSISQSRSLSDLVLELADAPNRANREAFYSKFVPSRVGVRVPAELGPSPIPSGSYVTVERSLLPIAMGTGPDGTLMLAVLCDIPELAKREPRTSFIELAGAEIIKLARANGAGIVVQASKDGRTAWAAIPAADVRRLAPQSE
jgi:hypothetical protein